MTFQRAVFNELINIIFDTVQYFDAIKLSYYFNLIYIYSYL